MNISPEPKKGRSKRSQQPSVLVGICSAVGNRERRDAVRETWLSSPIPSITCRFFVGGGEPLPDEPDTLVLGVPDSYNDLPWKVLDFFRKALESFEFDWLFKCDDDTYLNLARLRTIISAAHDLVGNEFLTERGSPSGGAGYLLSRSLVEKLAGIDTIPRTGAEDVLIGEAAIRLGAKTLATDRLCWNNSRFPERENDVITSHWCSPGRLRTIHAMLREAAEVVEVEHPAWKDNIHLFPSGYFTRSSTPCSGRWNKVAGGTLVLDWFDWDTESFLPGPPYRRVAAIIDPAGDASRGTDQSAHPLDPHGKTTLREEKQATVAVWMTTALYGLPHLDAFLASNPGVPVHVCSYPVLEGEAKGRAWRSADHQIRDWWRREGQFLKFDHAVFLEWDVLFTAPIDEVFIGASDFHCKDVKKPGQPWIWFGEIDRLPGSIRPHATGVAPLAVTRISRRCLSAMFSHAMADRLYSLDIFGELRLPTLAAACGYEPVECPGTLDNVEFHPVEAGAGSGVWHAIKHKTPEHYVPAGL